MKDLSPAMFPANATNSSSDVVAARCRGSISDIGMGDAPDGVLSRLHKYKNVHNAILQQEINYLHDCMQ
jgi:hypothetical protein